LKGHNTELVSVRINDPNFFCPDFLVDIYPFFGIALLGYLTPPVMLSRFAVKYKYNFIN